ncbi:uncharacterized protein LOC133036237 [Cannabis sativa]|uniref:uncharacterized protein LOC133036237 n=1 Tax=Cannabis sativa TaxID=3483 RepID=UPI0029CA3CA6|nr:uncharacterized protein LOC133036237 [Cannabis sativa]
MKFPTPTGVGSVRGVQSDSRECYNAAVKLAEKKSVNVIYLLEAPPPRQEVLRIEEVPHKDGPDLDSRILDYAATAEAAEDNIEVPMNPVDNSKVLKIGSKLTFQQRERLTTFLKQNLDVSLGNIQIWSEYLRSVHSSNVVKKVATLIPGQQHRSFNKLPFEGQALADFILEFPSTEVALINEEINTAIAKGEGWTLYVDGASNSEGSGSGILLISPNNFKVHVALCFEFSASNNEAKYEALISGLRLALEMRIEYLQAFIDSQIVVCQVNGEYLARGGRLVKYLALVCELMQKFKRVVLSRVPRAHNSHADAFARLASTREVELLDVIPVDVLAHPTINREEIMEIDTAQEVTWMTLIIAYLENGILPGDKMEARKLRQRAARYAIYDGRLYRRSFSQLLLKCIDGESCDYILRQVNESICGNHTGGNSLALKIMRQGYYCPTLRQDAFTFAKKCDKCQRITTYTHQPPSHLHSITSPSPFAVWGINLIGELPKGKGRVKYPVVAVEYFTKLVEAKALATITTTKLRKCVYNSIICRFGIPYKLISDIGKQIDCKEVRHLCDDLGIKKAFSAVAYPQSNGQTEAVNKIIKHTIKGKLEERKGERLVTQRTDSQNSMVLRFEGPGMARA